MITSTIWMDDLRFYVLFNSISAISGRWKVDNERLCAVELHLWLRRFCLEQGSNSVRQISRPALNPLSYWGSSHYLEALSAKSGRLFTFITRHRINGKSEQKYCSFGVVSQIMHTCFSWNLLGREHTEKKKHGLYFKVLAIEASQWPWQYLTT